MIECPGCGSNLIYDIARRDMYCKACGMEYQVETVEKDQDGIENSDMEISLFTCPQCAGEIYSTDDAATAFCSYCGASTMLSSRLKSERKPDYIIPFQVTKERCKDIYVEKMKKALYAPKELKSKNNIQEFRGIYMPYWLCDVEQKGTVQAVVRETYYAGDYKITDIYDASTDVDNSFENIAIDACSLFPDDISKNTVPFHLKNMKSFATGYLSGFYADLPDVDYEIYKDYILDISNQQAYSQLKNHLEQGKKEMDPPKNGIDSLFHSKISGVKTGLFPIWFMSYKIRDRIAYATVNGQTGKFVADIPMDIRKFLIGCLIGILPLYFLFDLVVTMRPSILLSLVSVIGAFVVWIHKSSMKRLAEKVANMDDSGLSARHSLNRRLERERRMKEQQALEQEKYGNMMLNMEEEPFVVGKKVNKTDIKIKEKPMIAPFVILALAATAIVIVLGLCVPDIGNVIFGDFFGMAKFIIAPISLLVALIGAVKGWITCRGLHQKAGVGGLFIMIGIGLGTGIIFLKPVMDQIYYFAIFILCATILIALVEITLGYNQLATRPLPQFEYKGGDDCA